jgi:hypothetical protein
MKIDDLSTSILFRIVGVTTMTQGEGQDELDTNSDTSSTDVSSCVERLPPIWASSRSVQVFTTSQVLSNADALQ